MTEEAEKKLAKYSKPTLIKHLAALGLINWRLLDMQEEAFEAERLYFEHEQLLKKIEALRKKKEKKLSLKERATLMRNFKRYQVVRARLDSILEKSKAEGNQ